MADRRDQLEENNLEQPLVGATSGVLPGQTVIQSFGDLLEDREPPPSPDAPNADQGSSGLAGATILLAKAMVGAGSAALPFAFARLGILISLGFLFLVAFMTHYSIEALAMATLVTGKPSYPATVVTVLGKSASTLLELSLVLRCAGLMVVYIVIATDILAGGNSLPGILCDILGDAGEGWCDARQPIALVLTATALTYLVTPPKLSAARATSLIGLSAAGLWATVTVALAAVSWFSGTSYPIHWLPDVELLSGGSFASRAVAMLSTLPVIATAYTCQMTVHFIMKELSNFSQTRITVVSAAAVTISTVFFLSVGMGSCSAFGQDVPADILELFNTEALSNIIPRWIARAMGVTIRFSFLLSILANFPMQMLPYRESATRLMLRESNLEGGMYYAITYGSLAVFYLVAMSAKSIWIPLQIVGATAGALIAFFFPAAIALRTLRLHAWQDTQRRPAYWIVNSWALIALGAVQVVTGVGALLLDSSRKP